jgi:hypothetical protein
MTCWKYAALAALLGLAGCGSDSGTPAPFSDAAVVQPDGGSEPSWPDGGWPEVALPAPDAGSPADTGPPADAALDAAPSDGALDATADGAETGD